MWLSTSRSTLTSICAPPPPAAALRRVPQVAVAAQAQQLRPSSRHLWASPAPVRSARPAPSEAAAGGVVPRHLRRHGGPGAGRCLVINWWPTWQHRALATAAAQSGHTSTRGCTATQSRRGSSGESAAVPIGPDAFFLLRRTPLELPRQPGSCLAARWRENRSENGTLMVGWGPLSVCNLADSRRLVAPWWGCAAADASLEEPTHAAASASC